MRTIILSLVKPIRSDCDLRVCMEGADRKILEWPNEGSRSHLSVVVAEGMTVPFGIFEKGHMISGGSLRVEHGGVIYNSHRVYPIIGETTESIFQRVQIRPSLFARNES